MSGKRSERKPKERRASNGTESVGSFIVQSMPGFVSLAFKLGLVYLRFKRKAKKAGKIFERELIKNGIDRETAHLLTQEYLKSSRIMRSFDFSKTFKDSTFEEPEGEWQ